MLKKACLSVVVVIFAVLAAIVVPDPHIDYRVKLSEPMMKLFYWKCGMYGNGSDFSRECLENLMSKMRIPPRAEPIDGVSTRDLLIPFALSKQTGWNGKIKARLFEPVNVRDSAACKEEKLPLIFYIHGGGFVVGAPDMKPWDDLCRVLANRTRAYVLSLDYRLAPEHPFPTAIYDVYSAFSWIDQNLQKTQNFNDSFFARIDPNKVIVAGDSAGGSLSIVTTFVARDGVIHLPSGEKLPPTKLQPKYQVLIYPAVDREAKTRVPQDGQRTYVLNAENMKFFTASYVQDHSLFEPSHPHHYLFKHTGANLQNLPNALVIVAAHDPLAGEDKVYAEELKQVNQAEGGVVMKEYDSVHGFITFFYLDECQRALDLIVQSILKHVGDLRC